MTRNDEFYRVFVDLYDRFFPLSGSTIDRVDSLLRERNAKRVLDVGCGTGSLVLALRGRGYQVEGTDASAAMIEVARRKAGLDGEAGQVGFRVETMESLVSQRAPKAVVRYGAMMCLGNTLCHARDRESVRSILAAMRGLLTRNGVVLIQGIDFSYVAEHDIRRLPVIPSDDHIFRRSYGQVDHDGRVRFSIRIERPAGPLTAEIDLLALGADEVAEMLRSVGFAFVSRAASLSGSGEIVGIEMVLVACAP